MYRNLNQFSSDSKNSQDYDGNEAGVYVAGGFVPGDKQLVPFNRAATCARQKELNAMEDAATLAKIVPGTVVPVPSIVVVPIVGTQNSSVVPLSSTQVLLAALQNNEQDDSRITTMDF